MSGRPSSQRVLLDLSQRDVAILAAALRQYEPYWSPADLDAAAQLSALAQDVMDLLARLRAVEQARPLSLRGGFAHTEPTLRLAVSDRPTDASGRV